MGYQTTPIDYLFSDRPIQGDLGLRDESTGPEGYRCGDCGKELTAEEFRLSLWGNCKECENERIGEVCAG